MTTKAPPRLTLRPYSAYKDSGLPWLGTVPEHWEIVPIRGLARPRALRGRPDLPLLSVVRDIGIIPRSEGENNHNPEGADLSTYKVVFPGDLVLNKMKTWQGSLGVSDYFGIVSPAYIVCDLPTWREKRFLHYLLRTRPYIDHYNRISVGIRIDQWDMRYEAFKETPVLLPPHEEQQQIARFIDLQSRRINRLITAKRRLIALLHEQKQAIIHRAVTRGLDPYVRLKPSGIDWLGDIPEHWQVRRIKQVADVVRGKFTFRPRNDPRLYDGPYPFIQTGQVSRASKFVTSYNQTLNEKGLAVSKMFPKGTLVMTIAANIGDVAVLTFDACFPDSVVGFIPGHIVNQDFLYNLFLVMKPEFLKEAPVNTQGNLNVERVGSALIPLPPVDEQARIANQAEDLTRGITAAIDRALQEIDLLREYRTRLIADVVTGKLDVRGVELPAVEDEVDVSDEGLDLDESETDDLDDSEEEDRVAD